MKKKVKIKKMIENKTIGTMVKLNKDAEKRLIKILEKERECWLRWQIKFLKKYKRFYDLLKNGKYRKVGKRTKIK